MNHLLPVAPILLLFALLLSPAAALAGAKQGISLWWGSVFPSLLPSFICLKLAQKLGLLRLCGRHPRGQLAAVIGFSLLSGAPSGARLLHALIEDGSLSSRDGARLLPVVNGVGPVFLLSIIASELLKNKALFPPMAAAYYGCAILLSFPFFLRRNGSDRVRGNLRVVETLLHIQAFIHFGINAGTDSDAAAYPLIDRFCNLFHDGRVIRPVRTVNLEGIRFPAAGNPPQAFCV